MGASGVCSGWWFSCDDKASQNPARLHLSKFCFIGEFLMRVHSVAIENKPCQKILRSQKCICMIMRLSV